eukprot:TRINITY_DN79979_c0_g1_i1.p1 TRINITY_DN79979_c0_g1~~TRINITY_DN79979_c0_g1_i1.p1  ORF type:complete len:106 (-),score=5.59 TRINITY_DN79979_c0_g1_i1:42-359(-)
MGWVKHLIAIWLVIVPDGQNNPASMLKVEASFVSSACTVSSSPKTSSPTFALIMASNIPPVGLVTVSLLKSKNLLFISLSDCKIFLMFKKKSNAFSGIILRFFVD